MQLEIDFDRDVVADLRLDVEEMEQAMDFAAREVTRQARVRGSRQLRAAVPGLSATKARSRVRAYRKGGGVWIGGNEVTASLRMPIIQAGRRPKVGPGGRPVIINNRVEPHAFVWLSRDIGRKTRYTGTPFRWLSRGKVQPVLIDISDEAQDLWQDLRAFTPERVDEIFRIKALQIVQTRRT